MLKVSKFKYFFIWITCTLPLLKFKINTFGQKKVEIALTYDYFFPLFFTFEKNDHDA
jgi:hypothetical protein